MIEPLARPMVERRETPLQIWRCPRCSRVLAKVRLGPGSEVEVKCHSCNTFSYRTVEESDSQ